MRVQVRIKAGGRGARLYLEVPEELVERVTSEAGEFPAYLERLHVELSEALLPAVLFAAGAEIEVPGAVALADGETVRTDIRAAPIPLSAGKE